MTGGPDPIAFDERARALIADYGGQYGGRIPLDAPGSVLVWCETGVFRYDRGHGVRWAAGALGLIDGLRREGDRVLIEVGGRTRALDIESGRAV